MNLTKEVIKEHSRKQRDIIVNYVGQDPGRFSHLVEVFLGGPYRVTQRAAWPLSVCVEKHPDLLKPHYKNILAFAGSSDIHDAVKRNILRMLQYVRVPKVYQGRIVDLCFGFLTDAKEPVAIRVFAMTVLANIATEAPDLKNELVTIIEDQLPFASAGFLSRSRKVLKQLKQ